MGMACPVEKLVGPPELGDGDRLAGASRARDDQPAASADRVPVQQHQTTPAGHGVTDGGSGDDQQPSVVTEAGAVVGVPLHVGERGVLPRGQQPWRRWGISGEAAPSDPLDAQNAARAVLSGRARARAKTGDGPVQIARMYKLTKVSAVKARTQAINQLKAVLVTADPVLREELAGLGNAELFRTCAQFTDARGCEEGGAEPVVQATRITLGLLAHRIGRLSEEIRDVEARLTGLVERHAPQLLDMVGIGPDTAVALLITVGDNPERLDSEASFAALCGVSPVERSSGRRQFRRLNRGGDRQANAALHRIVFTRLRVDPRTQDYYERRIKEGKTRREVVRCLKRHIAREVFHRILPVSSQAPS
jgi:transposase